MKIYFFLLFLVLLVQPASSQSFYTDSLRNFQYNYKKDLYAIVKKDTAFVQFYAVDPAYKVSAALELLPDEQPFSMATSGGKAKQATRFALLTFTIKGKHYRLFAYQLSSLLSASTQNEDFFVPFTDRTSGVTSYGGGRYMDFVIGEIKGGNKLEIDFNKAYNPYCAFVEGYICPIPPKENDLPAEVKAGEKNFGKSRH